MGRWTADRFVDLAVWVLILGSVALMYWGLGQLGSECPIGW